MKIQQQKQKQQNINSKNISMTMENDDWKALSEVAAAEQEEEKKEEQESTTVQDAAKAFLEEKGIGVGEKKPTKKRKKPKKKGNGKPAPQRVSAPVKQIVEQQRQRKAEEERMQAEEEAERLRIEEEEAKEREEEQKREEERKAKAQRRLETKNAQKLAGTYKTKGQKRRAKEAEQRLAAMRAAGMVPIAETAAAPKKVVYDNKKEKGRAKAKEQPKVVEPEEKVKQGTKVESTKEWTVEEAPKKEEKPAKEESSGDEWDADSDDDKDKFDDLTSRLEKVAEDLVAQEKNKEQERLGQLGLERGRIEAKKLARLEKKQEETTRQQQLAAQKLDEADDLRAPIVVVMGHVDTGKTKLLDKIRKTNVQEGEAGGITQQIGATYFERETLTRQTQLLNEKVNFDVKVPGMNIIDTPGHKAFAPLRSRGTALCDEAILVVDVFDLKHGLKPQTIDSLNLLRENGTPFVIALNKVDRCYGWKTCENMPIQEALEQQEEGVISEFWDKVGEARVALQEQGVNSKLYWEMGNEDWSNPESDFIPIVPTSAKTGEGVPDLILLNCQMAQRTKKLREKLIWRANLECTVLEVKAIDGLGVTVDALVVNGYLREGDKAAFCTLDEPIVTEIRALLAPPPSRETRVKSDYARHKEIKGARAVKIVANNLDKVVPGTSVMVIGPHDEEEDIKAKVMSDLKSLQEKLSPDKTGVMVQASTLGSLQGLLHLLRAETEPPVPVSAIGIGRIHKRDVTRMSVMNEKGLPEFATILAFDVEVDKEVQEYANDKSVKIFTDGTIYGLRDQFSKFMDNLTAKRREEAPAAVFPSICRILPKHIIRTKNPIILGVEVTEGILKVGTPLCVPSLDGLHLGVVTSIRSNDSERETARKGERVSVEIVNERNPKIQYGKHFDDKNKLYSTLTRASIDALKKHHKTDLEKEDWKLVIKLKKVFGII